MVDTLAFLKNDYTEEEIHKIIDEVNSYVSFFGGYGATLLKTTNAAIYREKKEGFEVPEDFIIGKLSADMLAIQKKFDEKRKSSSDDFIEFMSSSECNELMKARGEIADNYLTEHDGYNLTEYEPNKYVINARLNMTAGSLYERLLENMGIETTDIVHWWSDEFDQNTAFEFIKYEPKEIETNRYNFWLADTYTDEEVEDLQNTLSKSLEHIRYGIYDIDSANRSTSAAVIKVPVLDEYKKLEEFKRRLNSELWKKAMASGEPNKEMYLEIEQVLDKETAAYCKAHRIFDEREIKQGQIVLSILIVDEDIDAVKNVIASAGCALAFYSLDDYDCMKEIDLEYI